MNVAGGARLLFEELNSFLLVAGIVAAALLESIAGTALSIGRLDMIGDIHATPDEFARLDICYTAAKLFAFLAAPWFLCRLSPHICLRVATVTMTLGSGGAAITFDLDAQVLSRALQGAAGGTLLVAGQTLLFQTFPPRSQPVAQGLFAVGAVVAPATLTPFMQGWLVDELSWRWLYLIATSIGLAAIALQASAKFAPGLRARKRSLDWMGLALFCVAAVCLTYVLDQGERWRWFEEPMIVTTALSGGACLVLFCVTQVRGARDATLLDLSIFRAEGFAFGFVASFFAGFALSGSAYLIPTFAISVLGMTPREAGALLLPSTLTFIGGLLFTVVLVGRFRRKPFVTVPFGVVGLAAAMLILSRSNGDSGVDDLTPPILLRGLALGFLFLSITLVTLSALRGSAIPYGVGLFNAGRLTGGLIGVAFLETLIHRQTAASEMALASHLASGSEALAARLIDLGGAIAARGLSLGDSAVTAIQLLQRDVAAQATIIAYDAAFLSMSLLLISAMPILVVVKYMMGIFTRITCKNKDIDLSSE